MGQLISSLNLFLVTNSLLASFFILNQNDSRKDLTAGNNVSSASNPLEKITWVSLFSQLLFLLIQTKAGAF